MPFERRLYRYIEPKLSKEKKREKRGTTEGKGEKPMEYERQTLFTKSSISNDG